MRSLATKSILFTAILGLLLCVTDAEARSPISVRLIGGMTQSAANAVDNETDDLSPIFGLGARYALSGRHSLFLDVERIQRWPDFTYALSADTTLSREPLSEASGGGSSLVVMPVTLGYQFAISSNQNSRFAPYLSVGLSAVRLSSPAALSNRYPPLDPSSSEEIDESSGSDHSWKFGAMFGLGCSVRLNSRASLGGTAYYRHLDLPEKYSTSGQVYTHQNVDQIVFEGTDYDRNPVRARVGGFEGKLILEFRL
jgi:hypothetical protein